MKKNKEQPEKWRHGEREKAGSWVIRKQRHDQREPDLWHQGGLRTETGRASGRERLVGFQKGTDQWLSGQQWPPANRPTVPSSSRTLQATGQ